MALTTVRPENAAQIRQVALEAGRVLAAGGLLVFPTETVYGIGAAAAGAGWDALRRFKGRPERQPFTIHVASPQAAESYVDIGVPLVRRAIHKLFPGPITLVVELEDPVIDRQMAEMGLAPDLRERLYQRCSVGLRCPDHPVAREVLGSIAGPVVASSANRRGQAPPHDGQAAAAAVGEEAALIIDAGPARYALSSTIIQIGLGPSGVHRWQLQRAGVYDQRAIERMLRWTLLLVCSGNTCRSPMAEAIARRILAQRRGIRDEDLEAAGLRVVSAGLAASSGLPASPEAVAVMAREGLDLSRHRSRPLSAELLREADVIYCMSAAHAATLRQIDRSAAAKTARLDPDADIEDPLGDRPEGYERCAGLIRQRLEQRLVELAV